ncbi:MAG: bifunctional 5,10-methylenetetrahydrofolate dehydrogenase/5,10-methenyltetrahydrofolate cyclohydrolase [Patescibacteria group bacterium]
MIIDGRKMAEEIKTSLKKEVETFGKKIRLAVVFVGDDPISKKFIEQKKKLAKDIGVDVRVYNFPLIISTNELRKKISEVVHLKQNSGVIIQLPLPKQIKTQYILNAIPLEKDVDVLSARAFGDFSVGKEKVLPPIVGAVKKILITEVALPKKYAVIVGAGRLVGRPLAIWFLNQGATISVLNENTKDISDFAKKADILISGVGKPGLVNDKMVKKGAVVIDAGTSESKGKLVGDVDPKAAKKASLFTPVPGGVGPLVVAMVFQNLISLAKLKKK